MSDLDDAGSSPSGERESSALVLEALSERLKERIYAAITMLAVVVGMAQNAHTRHRTAALYITGTAVGLWLATLVADTQAHRVIHRRMPVRRDLRHLAFVSSPLLSCAVGPLLMVALSAAGAVGLSTALWIAVGVDVCSLAGWGFAGGRRMGDGVLLSSVAGVANAVIGLGVVLVKVVTGH
ncbi:MULTISPECIES: hypothetical protein [unclassified Streptomyces]|uniref:hypothetical protein n=1 Tax=unclassified Streptomyces TaxID=2593676 RepID=UPI000DAF16FB|nr:MULTISPECIES: hypothetical protein [unclassified Streptomyces]PZT73802.1 hypothetical protein DNK55_16465 [Streptomyces sp. AC1-42T]PZT83201.1 hypothetical protein DNK56_14960 [Streptomyces sp. AC1-42W]